MARARKVGPATDGTWKRTVYVAQEDRAVWAEAQRISRDRGESLSSWIADGLRLKLECAGEEKR